MERTETSLVTKAAPGLFVGGTLQRKCDCGQHAVAGGSCSQCSQKKATLQRKASGTEPANDVPPIVDDVLGSPGQPLDTTTRAFMEPRFGHDFSRVRVHTDPRASESAQAVNALAYTAGRNVVFGAGQYAPQSSSGKKLLAHELTHVVQKLGDSARASSGRLTVGDAADAREREADAVSIAVVEGEKAGTRLRDGNPNTIRAQHGPSDAPPQSDGRPGCAVRSGITNSVCSAYLANSWWLPWAYVNNATCACLETPNVPTAKCVRKFLQDRLAATPGWFKAFAAAEKSLEFSFPLEYQTFVQAFLTPRIHQDHVDAYAACCCPSGPAIYPAWIGVTSVPLPCSAVGASIRQFGSCHGTPGTW
ncbi:MAG: DUF4157 domain-containing protein [Acidobacteriota bacterium]